MNEVLKPFAVPVTDQVTPPSVVARTVPELSAADNIDMDVGPVGPEIEGTTHIR
jgi:hypothetical protein